MADEFTREERAALAPYVTNLDGPVFALVNLPEVVKGALFARYSRSSKSLRRLFLDEFLTPEQREKAVARAVKPPPKRQPVKVAAAGRQPADQLHGRALLEAGADPAP